MRRGPEQNSIRIMTIISNCAVGFELRPVEMRVKKSMGQTWDKTRLRSEVLDRPPKATPRRSRA